MIQSRYKPEIYKLPDVFRNKEWANFDDKFKTCIASDYHIHYNLKDSTLFEFRRIDDNEY